MESKELQSKKAVELSRRIVAAKWAAYKAIMNGGKYCTGDKETYKSVKKRLKSVWRGSPQLEERLKRFIYLEE